MVLITGLTPGYRPWTHHGHYRDLMLEWYDILVARDDVSALMNSVSIGGFDVRYAIDVIGPPTEEDRLGSWVFLAEDGTVLATVYALGYDGMDRRLRELAKFLGREVFLTPVKL